MIENLCCARKRKNERRKERRIREEKKEEEAFLLPLTHARVGRRGRRRRSQERGRAIGRERNRERETASLSFLYIYICIILFPFYLKKIIFIIFISKNSLKIIENPKKCQFISYVKVIFLIYQLSLNAHKMLLIYENQEYPLKHRNY